MIDVFEVADRLVALTRERYPDEVSLIAYYGSRATGTDHLASDLDLFYIPADGKNPDAARCFIVDGLPFDFWPMSWEMVERIADARFRNWAVAPSILSRAVVLWARSEADRMRFKAVRARIDGLAEDGEERSRRAAAAFPAAVRALERGGAWPVVTACLDCLALANGVTFDGGWTRAMSELDRLEARPPDLLELVPAIVTSTDPAEIRELGQHLVDGTRAVLSFRPAASVFRGTYPEIREHVVKLVASCGSGDAVRASLETWVIEEEVRGILERSDAADPALPDLLAAYDPGDLSELRKRAFEFDARLVAWLDEIGAARNVFADLDELDAWLRRS